MLIDPALWPKIHGATTHFPMALTMSAALFEGLAALSSVKSRRRPSLHAAGYYCIILGALGTVPAVLSGLFMTKGEVLGHDALLFHHLFVWPAFTALIALAVWRFRMGENYSQRGFGLYLFLLGLTAGLMGGAGYWGGELILNS